MFRTIHRSIYKILAKYLCSSRILSWKRGFWIPMCPQPAVAPAVHSATRAPGHMVLVHAMVVPAQEPRLAGARRPRLPVPWSALGERRSAGTVPLTVLKPLGGEQSGDSGVGMQLCKCNETHRLVRSSLIYCSLLIVLI